MKHAIRFLMLALVTVSLLSLTNSPASAQDDESGFRGTLKYDDADGEAVPIEGVTLTIDGPTSGEVQTGADGTFTFPVEPGTYSVTVNIDTLPEGVTLRNPDRNPLTELEVTEGQSRNLLFPLNSSDVAIVENTGDGFGTKAAQLAVGGLIFGLIIAMCSIGLSLIFGTTGLTNFAHGELVTFGALIALMLNDPDVFGMGIIVAGFIAVLATGVAAGANERFLWKPLRSRGTGLIAMLVISIGLSILVRYIMLYQAGGNRATYTQYSLQSPYEWGPITIVPRELWIIGISVFTLLAVALAVQRTKIGKAMRAVSDNKDLAESSGIDVERVILIVWVVGGALAGLGGVLFGLNEGVSWDMGFELLLLMFAAVTLGGLGTAYGPLFGSIIVGMFINLSTLVIPPELKNVGALMILVLILLIRPQGLFGEKGRIG